MANILMCAPDFYGIHYEINPWMKVEFGVNHEIALTQWKALCDTLKQCGAELHFLTPAKGWPDLVFTANGGLILGEKQVVLPYFKYPERQGELTHFKEWFEKQNFRILNPHPEKGAHFEGAGDALFAGDLLFVGYGFRSDKDFFEKATYLPKNNLIYCELIDPYFYHLDTCFCPLNHSLALWYPEAFSVDARREMEKNIELIAVTEAEAKEFACNAVVINKHVILPTNTPVLQKILEKHQFQPHPLPMSEFIKAGGACKCLTLQLD